MRRFTTPQATTVLSSCLIEIMKCGWFRKMNLPKKMNEKKNPGSSIAYCRHQHYLPVKCRSSCSTWENCDERSLFPRCLLMLEALSRYTGNRGQYSRNMWINQSQLWGSLFLWGSWKVSCYLTLLHMLPFLTWICVIWMLSPPDIINKNAKELSCMARLGCEALWGEVQLKTKIRFFCTWPCHIPCGLLFPSCPATPTATENPTVPKRVDNIAWQRTNLWS